MSDLIKWNKLNILVSPCLCKWLFNLQNMCSLQQTEQNFFLQVLYICHSGEVKLALTFLTKSSLNSYQVLSSDRTVAV